MIIHIHTQKTTYYVDVYAYATIYTWCIPTYNYEGDDVVIVYIMFVSRLKLLLLIFKICYYKTNQIN